MNLPFRTPLIAILRGVEPDEILAHVDVLVEEGWDAIEVPLNSPDWQRSIALAVRAFGHSVCLGGGTVLHNEQIEMLAHIGAKLVVTPNTDARLIRHAVAREMTVVAGFASASEAFAALRAGAHALKLFPAGSYGPAHLRALRAVLPATPVFAVGGVTPASLPAWLAAGGSGAGIGGELYRPGQPAERTRAQARLFMQAWQGAAR